MAPSLPLGSVAHHHTRGGGGSAQSRRRSCQSCVLRLVRWHFLKDALLIAALGLFLDRFAARGGDAEADAQTRLVTLLDD